MTSAPHSVPDPAANSASSASDHYAIYPAIGVARVGNAPDAYYIGPEVYGGLPTLPGTPAQPLPASFSPTDFRDAQGLLCRQAAQFRIYRNRPGHDAEEITLDHPDIAEIHWTVHLANKKASWYIFQTLNGEAGYAPNHALRNAGKASTAERLQLIIDPGPRSIAGRWAGSDGASVHFSRDTIPSSYQGSFPPRQLKPYTIDTLGALLTDAQGRLRVLGGLGHSGTDSDSPAIGDYANNDGWWDDTGDGPVEAVVILRTGARIQAQAAWVLVAPPAYAPQIPNLVTLYDTIFDTAVRHQQARPDLFSQGLWRRGAEGYKPYFDSDIRPIFERANLYPWVAAIPPKPHTFDFAKLGDPDPRLNGLRGYFLDALRPPGQDNVIVNNRSGATMMPYLAGDNALSSNGYPAATTATAKYLRLTDTQYFLLQQWRDGHFRSGAAPQPHPGEALSRAVLENCVGGAFSPGIEMTWVARNPAIYSAPFRIKVRQLASACGPLSLGFDPIAGLEPGDVCRYMAVPWQADFNECSSQSLEGRVLWWWPAQRPEYVYLPVPAAAESASGPGEWPKRQVAWIGTDYDQNASGYISFPDDLEMVEKWHQLGFVYNVGEPDAPYFVEVARTLPREPGA